MIRPVPRGSFAIEAANAYLNQWQFYLQDNEGLIYLVNNIRRVAEISVMLNASDLAVKAVKCMVDSLPHLFELGGYHYFSELVETLDFIGNRFTASVSPHLWQQVRENALQAITSLEQQTPLNDLLLQLMVEVVIVSFTRLGDEQRAWDYRVRIAEIFENEAHNRDSVDGSTNGGGVALKSMEDAIRTYLKLLSIAPNAEERNKIIRRVEVTKREVRRLIRPYSAPLPYSFGALLPLPLRALPLLPSLCSQLPNNP